MPRISAFYGIVITMHFRDHPPPHFRAEYGEHVAEIDRDADVLHGRSQDISPAATHQSAA